MIEAHNLFKTFKHTLAVDDATFTIGTGITGLVGPNGAGKTTLLKILAGIETPDRGQLSIDQPKSSIGYLPEAVPLYPQLGVGEILLYFARLRLIEKKILKSRIETVAHQCQLQSVWHKRCHELSKGFRQRVGLALALLHDPQILILDEPTDGLDPVQITEVRALVQSFGENKTVIVSSHSLSEIARLCQTLIVISRGRVVAQGSAPQFGQTPEALEKRFLELVA